MSEVRWTRLCEERAARQGESPAGIGWEGEGVSVRLLCCLLQTSRCLPTASPPQKGSKHLTWKQPSQFCLLQAHINLFFFCLILPFPFPSLRVPVAGDLKVSHHVPQGNTLVPLSSETLEGGAAGDEREEVRAPHPQQRASSSPHPSCTRWFPLALVP